MPIEKILVVEDNEFMSKEFAHQLRERRYSVVTAPTLAAARHQLGKDEFDLLFLDLTLPDGQGMELLQELQQRPQRPLVIVITGQVSVQSAVDCMRNGAFDYLTKPFSFEAVDAALEKADKFSRLVNVNRYLNHDRGAEPEGELLGKSQQMEQLRQLIRKVARTEATVLIQGESGTGKELIARALYNESPRANAPFIRVNCAAVPENLIESEFFGHEKGAFTGAFTKREGRFELSHGGTILLDEISEIPLQLQAKLLRVLQERELERVGGTRTIKVDVRVISTTNRNLEEAIEKKGFRQDLYFRLNVVPIHVPPLRERRDDIAYLAGQFMQRFARKHGVHVDGFSSAAMEMMHDHWWPGNVREMQNVIERAIILCSDGEIIEPRHLGLLAVSAPAPESPRRSPLGRIVPSGPQTQFPTLSELERQHIMAALAECNNNRTHAARLLDISVRTLRNKLNEYRAETSAAAVAE
ncbi:MAG TPA: sigma-54 dependent transcriptional regulator [Verrucomicrobiae bacterium]|nr:sigma-54 dependent transcriptional regulator [Verrucomicrobiae bacterium]